MLADVSGWPTFAAAIVFGLATCIGVWYARRAALSSARVDRRDAERFDVAWEFDWWDLAQVRVTNIGTDGAAEVEYRLAFAGTEERGTVGTVPSGGSFNIETVNLLNKGGAGEGRHGVEVSGVIMSRSAAGRWFLRDIHFTMRPSH